eukprot:789277-Pyramimonas_sp.AAC.1
MDGAKVKRSSLRDVTRGLLPASGIQHPSETISRGVSSRCPRWKLRPGQRPKRVPARRPRAWVTGSA